MTGNETEFIHLRDWGDAPKETPHPKKRIGMCIVYHFDNGLTLIGQGEPHQTQLRYACALDQNGVLHPAGQKDQLFLDDIFLNKDWALFYRYSTWPEQRNYEDALVKYMKAKQV